MLEEKITWHRSDRIQLFTGKQNSKYSQNFKKMTQAACTSIGKKAASIGTEV